MSKQLKISFLDSPCYKCPDRYPGCHSECDEYIEFRKSEDDLKKKDRTHRIAYYSDPYGKKRRG